MKTKQKFLISFIAFFIVGLWGGYCACPFSSQFSENLSPKIKTDNQGILNEGKINSDEYMEQIPSATNMTSALVRINQLFRKSYKQTVLNSQPKNYIIFETDYLILFKNGIRVSIEPAVTDLYHNLKNVLHIPLNVYVSLQPYLDKHISDAQDLGNLRQQFSKLSQATDEVVQSLSLYFSEQVLYAQERAMDKIQSFIKLISSRLHRESSPVFTSQLLEDFTRGMQEEIEYGVNLASREEVIRLHQIVTKWRRELLTPEEWSNIKISIPISHLPRKKNLASQYFSRVFSLQGEIDCSDNLFTIENTYNEESLLYTMGQHFVDYGIGETFFNSHFRMHDDLLKDGATKAIKEIFG